MMFSLSYLITVIFCDTGGNPSKLSFLVCGGTMCSIDVSCSDVVTVDLVVITMVVIFDDEVILVLVPDAALVVGRVALVEIRLDNMVLLV